MKLIEIKKNAHQISVKSIPRFKFSKESYQAIKLRFTRSFSKQAHQAIKFSKFFDLIASCLRQ